MLRDVTIIVKAFERPESLLRLYKSIRTYYPSVNIIIVDDGKKTVSPCEFDDNVIYFATDFNIGLSAGRNYAVSHVKTKYFLLLDDDFVFTKKTKLENMYNLLEATDFDVVSGLLYDFGKIKRRFAGCFDIENGMFVLHQDRTRGEISGHKLYDIVLNFFMARTESIQRVGWDPELKLGEHKDFFIRAKEHGLKCTVLDNVSIFHFPEQLDDYAEYRNRARAYEMLAFEKHGIYAEKIIQPISATRLWVSLKTCLKKSSFLVMIVHLLKKKLT